LPASERAVNPVIVIIDRPAVNRVASPIRKFFAFFAKTLIIRKKEFCVIPGVPGGGAGYPWLIASL